MQLTHPERTLSEVLVPTADRDTGWTLEMLLARPNIIPKHFPADRYGPATLSFDLAEFKRHAIGTVGYLDGATSARHPDVAFNVLRSYRVLLPLLGLTVDHHGWLYAGDPVVPNPTLSTYERLMPRVLRCLQLLELRGYSASGYQDGHSYSYAAGLASKLIDLLDLRDDGTVLSTECYSALIAS